jgi:uncharacterized protein
LQVGIRNLQPVTCNMQPETYKNMIIDAHTHIYPDDVAGKALKTVIDNTKGKLNAWTDGTFHGLLSSMDNAGVDFSIVLPIATDPRHGIGILEWIRQSVHFSPRVIFFGSVHPYDPDFRTVIRQMKELGIQGIKLHPAYQGFPVDSMDVYGVYEEVLRNDLILHFHAGLDRSLPESDYTSVKRFSRFMSDFQGSRIILANAGGDGEWDKVLDLLGDKKCYYDVSFVLEDMSRDEHAKELYRLNEDYFVFGTDSPWRDQARYVQLVRNSDFLTEEQKSKLFYKTILKLIKIGP